MFTLPIICPFHFINFLFVHIFNVFVFRFWGECTHGKYVNVTKMRNRGKILNTTRKKWVYIVTIFVFVWCFFNKSNVIYKYIFQIKKIQLEQGVVIIIFNNYRRCDPWRHMFTKETQRVKLRRAQVYRKWQETINLIIWDISRKFLIWFIFNKALTLHLKSYSSENKNNSWCYVEKYKMYKLCIQIHTLLPGGKSPWYSKGHAKCKHVTWSIHKLLLSINYISLI